MREGKEGFTEDAEGGSGVRYTDDDFFIGPTPEEEAEAAFYFFIQDLNHYAQNGKWGPRLWESISEETRAIIRNQVKLEMMGYDMKGSFRGYSI